MPTTLIKRLSLSLLLAASSVAAEELVPLERVAAIVDKDIVLASEVQQRLIAVSRKLMASQTELPPADILQRQILEQLILERLQHQKAEKAQITISTQEINNTIRNMRKTNKLSEAQLEAKLKQDGLSMEELRVEVHNELLLNRTQQGYVNRRIQIGEHEIELFLASPEGKFWQAPSYELGHILLPLPRSGSASEIKAVENLAQDLRKQLLEGVDFRQLALSHSKGQQALQGGDWGWRKVEQMPGLFAQAVSSLQAGDISDVLRSGAGFHLLKVYDIRGGGETLVKQYQSRHILLKTSAIRNDGDAYRQLLDMKKRLESGEADFNVLAKEHSDDLGSALQGGELGWSKPGQMVEEFEQQMELTPKGAYSEPFRSQFGWHLLQVTDVRTEDMSEDLLKAKASQLLRKRRFSEELPLWLRELRNQAYIDIKDAYLSAEELAEKQGADKDKAGTAKADER